MKSRLFSYFLFAIFAACINAQTIQQADSLHQRGRELLDLGNITEGRECTRQAMEMRKKLLGEVSEDYITSLNNYASTFSMENNYAQAREILQKVMELCDKLPSPHSKLAMFVTNMAGICYFCGDMQQAVHFWEMALPLTEKFSEKYEHLLSGLAMAYDELHDQQGVSRIMALMQEHNEHELTKPCDEPKCMMERAQYYGATGNQAMAKECFLKALAMPMDDEMKAQLHETYATYLSGTARDYASAADYCLSAANLRKMLSGETEQYANLMYKAGMFAFIGKNFEQAIDAYQIAIDFFKRNNTAAAKKNVALCFKGMGNAYSGLKDYAKARDCHQEVVSYYEQYDQANEEYPKAILRVAKAEKFNKEYTPSIVHHKQAMALFDARSMTTDYADAASSLQSCYTYAGITDTVDQRTDASHAARMERIDELIKTELEGLDQVRDYLGKLMYARSLATLGGCYEMKEDWENSVKFYLQYMPVVREAIRDEFRLQNEGERMIVWNDEKKDISSMLELLLELPDNTPDLKKQMAAAAYDAELLSKGILLNSAIEFENVLASKDDNQLKDVYEQSKANEAEIEQLRRNAASEEDLNRILELTQQNQALQLELYRGCAEYADFTNYISYTWQDVQHALTATDIAIEFAIIGNSFFTSDNQLVALILTADMESPQAIPVCSAKTLDELETTEALYENPDGGTTIWGIFKDLLIGKQRIFFSADGTLNRIGIEYLQYESKPLSEQFKVYRLSSTKELCYRRQAMRAKKAVLFGDINYNDSAITPATSHQSVALARGSAEAEGFADLANTRREVNDIETILKRGGIADASVFKDTDASKKAFLQLSGAHVNLLHIATHGTYKEVRKASDTESMLNSRLAFAGANLDSLAMLTASEIAAMDLRLCDLAVLSACETGLGKLGGDGVFGLQRGFKNAGVRTLLMSLKNVYDDSTADLMISFYKHLMDGCTKREALIKAQQDIKSKGYTDPKYWAAFIMLDGLD